MSRSRALGRGRRARQRGCATSRTSCIASLIAAGPSLPATAGPSTSFTDPFNSATGMDPFGDVSERQQTFGTCFSYSKTPGPTSICFSSESSPLQLFSQFLTDEVFDLLVVETNRYAGTVCGTSSHARPWTDVTVQEMKSFLRVVLDMGITVPPQLELYWTTKYLLNIHGDPMSCPSIDFSSSSGASI